MTDMTLTKKQNLLKTIGKGEPERFVNQYEPFAMPLGLDPLSQSSPMHRQGETWVDPWGVIYTWQTGSPGAMPVHEKDTILLKDIREWRTTIKPPNLEFPEDLWQSILEFSGKVDREDQFLTMAVAPGLFEQTHHFMSMSNALMALVLETEAMKALVDFLVEWEISYAQQIIERLHPDALHHHDDWGSATSTLMSPALFREVFVPAYKRLYGFYKANGIQLVIHHSDSYAATLVPDMIDMGIDIWQGAMSTNDLPFLIRKYGGRISFMGGIDDSKVDTSGWSQKLVADEVEKVCLACGKKYFIPGLLQGMPASAYPGVYDAVSTEIDRMSGKIWGSVPTIPGYSDTELTVKTTLPNYNGVDPVAVYSFPVTAREGVKALYNRQPVWQVMTGFGPETTIFSPQVIPDSIARAHVYDGTTVLGVSNRSGGKDMFGRDWVFDAAIGGSTVIPGSPVATDVEELLRLLTWPDIDLWDWNADGEVNREFLSTDNYYLLVFMNGYFERLVSLIDFENALMALYVPEQKDAVHSFFDRLTSLYEDIFEHVLQHFPKVNGISFHDDWGGSLDCFFSPQTAAEMIVPYMRRLTDYLHGKGLDCDLHSCGKNHKQVENYIAAGWDSWTPQDINDTLALYDEFGDRIIIATIPEVFDPKEVSESEQRSLARVYADHVCHPDKPSSANLYGYINHPMYTPAFREELYIKSRQNYSRT
jgi:uroporphyrinogen-III decarboxylase